MPRTGLSTKALLSQQNDLTIGLCNRLGGEIDRDNKVCDVGGFPAPATKPSPGWGFCAPILLEALRGNREAAVLRMSPEDAAKLYPQLRETEGTKERINDLRQKIRNKEPICPPWLEGCFDLLEVRDAQVGPQTIIDGFEGRTRIHAAIQEDIEQIPVVLISPEKRVCRNRYQDI